MTNFRKFRVMNNIRQSELARLAGVTTASVCRLDKHGCFDTRTAMRYAKALKCNPLLLLDGLEFDFTSK